MIRVDIESIIMAAGPVPSVIVLRERQSDDESNAPRRALSIQTGPFEAASVSHGIDRDQMDRPITHDIMVDMLRKLNATVEHVEVVKVEPPVFYATIALATSAGERVEIDARPSDALALAVRTNAPIFVEDDVMNRAGSITHAGTTEDTEEEIRRFDKFVQSVSPDDF